MRTFLILLLSISSAHAAIKSPQTICGKDDRAPSKLKPIARMMESDVSDAGCTGTLISKSCMISAGHCVKYLNVAQFQVPESNAFDGKVNHPGALDQYPLEVLIASRYEGVGKDWAVYKMKANPLTGKKPGEVQGTYSVNTTAVFGPTTEVRITGYGASSVKQLNFTQQTSTGDVLRVKDGMFSYRVDTMGGNSGSAVIIESTQEIVGIHTNGGCSAASMTGGNQGTLISTNPDLVQAIEQCLSMDQ